MLREGILAGEIDATTDPKKLFESNPEFHKKWKISNFKTNLKNLIKAIANGNGKVKVESWRKSKAKELLCSSIVAGKVTKKMKAADVYKMNAEYQLYPFENFTTNLKNLLETVSKEYKQVLQDCEFYGHDIALIKQLEADKKRSVKEVPSWHKSSAKQLLIQDMDDGKHNEMTKLELYNKPDRLEYREYSLKEFRDRIYQEEKKRRNIKIRYDKKKSRMLPPRPDIVGDHHLDLIASDDDEEWVVA